MALASAVATLLAALFVCLGGVEPGDGDHHGEAADSAPATYDVRAVAVTETGEYVCPYDRGGCSLLPSLSPAVLGAPPLDSPLHAAGGHPRLDTAADAGPAHRSGARPRAPDLHVLQVLRT
ncbi:hypothetical protein AB0G79_08770 [Streptomyces sp. NPDC020807]|uniref:hypothetical protein n=1 Tax=Streptomyces sp. NPDC020807 TaxID=3155119 RepID=UPI0033D9DA44